VTSEPAVRTRNRRGEGSRLRQPILDAAQALLDEIPSSPALRRARRMLDEEVQPGVRPSR